MPITRRKQIEDSDTEHFISERQKRAPKAANVQPPLTPMIDVTFQLLLYFLLTIQFREDEGQIPGSLPAKMGPASETDPNPDKIEIHVTPEGPDLQSVRYSIGGQGFLDVPSMQAHLLERKGAYSKKIPPVIIRCRGDVRWKFVVEAFNATMLAQFEEVGFGYM